MAVSRRLGAGPALINRRRILQLGVGASVAARLGLGSPSPAGATAVSSRSLTQSGVSQAGLRPSIRPRSDWAGLEGSETYLAPTGPIADEPDVRFLLVHHTASDNDYQAHEVPEYIRSFFSFHTGPEKGWPDVAYNFFVDRYGGIWEGRAGSIDRAVAGDATGGSQGFAQLCSLVGNHHEAEVTEPQKASLIDLLAWLAETYQVDTTPGAVTSFQSRGSNRWPQGAQVTTATIAGHRDMSQTACPGDFAYRLVTDELPTQVSARRQLAQPVDSQPAGSSTSSTGSTSTGSTSTGSTPTDPTTPQTAKPSTPQTANPATNTSQSAGTTARLGPDSANNAGPPPTDATALGATEPLSSADEEPVAPLAMAGTMVAAAAAALAAITRFRSRSQNGA